MTVRPDPTKPLAGVRVVEISSFVAVPLAGMTLAQLGAEVIRVDPIGGAADYHRWPVTDQGESIYWAGLNKGKRSLAVDMRSGQGRELVARLIADSGVFITNVIGRQWHSYEELSRTRSDLIHLEVSGRVDGGTGVDYTVNAAIGFPLVTGPPEFTEPVNHVLPAWDVTCGIYVALAVTTALRHRDATGLGQHISIPLENVALATAGNLSLLTEAMVNGASRQRIGNAVYGTYGQDFVSADGVAFMIVVLTGRHFRDLTALTRTTDAVAALADSLGADFSDEGQRYRHRDALSAMFADWFAAHTGEEIVAGLSSTSVLWERYQTFAETAAAERVTANPMFAELDQPRVGRYLAPGLPMSIDGAYPQPVSAPALGDDTTAVLAEWLSLPVDEIDGLINSGVVA
ncbi:MAG: CoA transferase [Actinomycetia bacterium]|nr:CoA transferase [Actinomycetes bacterium]